MKLINTPIDCTIKAYMTCRFRKDFSVLIIEGEPTKEELLAAWEKIETEFNDICGTKSAELVQIDKINRLIARNEAVKGYFFCVDECLRRANAPFPEALQRLSSNGVNIKWDGDIIKYKKDIETAKKKDKSNQVKLIELNTQLATIKEKSPHSKEYTQKDFYSLKQAIQSVAGYNISETETNMFDFGVMCFNYFEMIKNQSPN